MLRYAIALVAAVSCTSPASAKWLNTQSGGDFDGKPAHVAGTESGGYLLAFRCQNESSELRYLTPEEAPSESVLEKLAEIGKPALRLRVDDGEILTLAAAPRDHKDRIMWVGEGPNQMIAAIQAAKRTVSITVTIKDENVHERRFAAVGAKTAMDKLISGCKIDLKK